MKNENKESPQPFTCNKYKEVDIYKLYGKQSRNNNDIPEEHSYLCLLSK